MQIEMSGHKYDVTDALKQYTNEKFERILRHFDHGVTSIKVVFSKEHLDRVAEATIRAKGAEFHAKSPSEDMYAAVDLLVDKLDKQVKKHKEKMTHHRD